MKKDYCSCFPDMFKNKYIGDCCKKHDNDVGMRGTYNPFTPHINFYKCLRTKELSIVWSSIITFGGIVGTLIKLPYLYYKKYKYRKGKNDR